MASQPTGNAALRMRLWREMKALGAAILRDGVYLLPHRSDTAAALESMAVAVRNADGSAHLMQVPGTDAQNAHWEAGFDRSAQYGELLSRMHTLAGRVSRASVDVLRKQLRELEGDLQQLIAIDYFPGTAQRQAAQALDDLRASVERWAAPDEPRTTVGDIVRLQRADYIGRVWATRRRLWADRVASAWLIRRFIDPQARFVWLRNAGDKPKRAVGFDFDGAEFTHRSGRVTFEVLQASFGLDDDAALLRLGTLVHALDVGGIAVPEAAATESLLTGLRRMHEGDDDFLAAAGVMFDGWYAAFRLAAEASDGSTT